MTVTEWDNRETNMRWAHDNDDGDGNRKKKLNYETEVTENEF